MEKQSMRDEEMRRPRVTARASRYTSWIVAPLMSYPRKTWISWILLILWFFQLLFMTVQIITISLLIFEVEGEGNHVDRGWIVCLAFVFVCILLTAAEAGLWFVRALHPWTFLGIQVFKTTFWTLWFAVGLATTVLQRVITANMIWPFWKYLQAASSAAALYFAIAALIYGSFVAHRYRKSGKIADMWLENRTYHKEEQSDWSDRTSWHSRMESQDGQR